MLKITMGRMGMDTVVRLEGKVAGPWVSELRTACAAAQGDRPPVIDLLGVTFMDPDGVALLRELAANGSTLANGSPFVMAQLNTTAE